MFFSRALLITTILAPLALATPTAGPTRDVTCGTKVYTPTKVSTALAAGYSRLSEKRFLDGFPHTFRNLEKLPVSPSCSGSELFEFPLVSGGAYPGGDAGPDRVVFTSAGLYCTVMTHTGARPNSFVSCRGAL
ncbi:guanyl-specific ribonuclease C2 [Mycena leptocephala]|nr:guanyl-specific ribonuclease C2 [Mycena leptocephala]